MEITQGSHPSSILKAEDLKAYLLDQPKTAHHDTKLPILFVCLLVCLRQSPMLPR